MVSCGVSEAEVGLLIERDTNNLFDEIRVYTMVTWRLEAHSIVTSMEEYTASNTYLLTMDASQWRLNKR